MGAVGERVCARSAQSRPPGSPRLSPRSPSSGSPALPGAPRTSCLRAEAPSTAGALDPAGRVRSRRPRWPLPMRTPRAAWRSERRVSARRPGPLSARGGRAAGRRRARGLGPVEEGLREGEAAQALADPGPSPRPSRRPRRGERGPGGRTCGGVRAAPVVTGPKHPFPQGPGAAPGRSLAAGQTSKRRSPARGQTPPPTRRRRARDSLRALATTWKLGIGLRLHTAGRRGPRAPAPLVTARAPRHPEQGAPRGRCTRRPCPGPRLSGFRTARRALPAGKRLPRRRRRARRGPSGPGHVGPAGN